MLNRDESSWTLAESEDSDKLNQEQATQLGRALSALEVTGVAESSPEFSTEDVKTIEVEGDTKQHYQFIESDDKYYVKTDHRE